MKSKVYIYEPDPVLTVGLLHIKVFLSFHIHDTVYTRASDHTPAISSCKMGTLAAEVVEVFN